MNSRPANYIQRVGVVEAAFSLIEILVTIALLSFIILGLLSMFTQTQKAFTGAMKQVDIMEAGRAITDQLVRELSQITPSRMPDTVNFFAQASAVSATAPLLQELPGATDGLGNKISRTNIIQKFFFVSQVNQDWIGTGYEVISDQGEGAGTLYRFTTNRTKWTAYLMSRDFTNAPLTNLSRIAEGIVHLRVRAFATNGFPIVPLTGPARVQIPYNGLIGLTNGFATLSPFLSNQFAVVKGSANLFNNNLPDQPDYYFWSNAVPAYLELELGVLEPKTFERFKAIGPGNAAAQREYLAGHVAQVHLFRQRIPIRNVDFRAYQ